MDGEKDNALRRLAQNTKALGTDGRGAWATTFEGKHYNIDVLVKSIHMLVQTNSLPSRSHSLRCFSCSIADSSGARMPVTVYSFATIPFQ